jgi:hypothetical protein
MFELVKIAENKQFNDRIFPVVLSDAEIYDPVKRLGYVKYWEEKRNSLARAIREVDPANLQGIREEMDMYDRVRDEISGLASTLKDMNALTPEMHRESNFSHLYDAIEKRTQENQARPAAAAVETVPPEGPAPSEPGSKVTAGDGSTAVGSLQIGGNVDGSIVIGNNNSISDRKTTR